MEEPKLGEWWMVQSTDTKRMCPMMKTVKGWTSFQNAEGKPLKNYIQTRPIFTALYRMVKS
jgi:hypothetical protein